MLINSAGFMEGFLIKMLIFEDQYFFLNVMLPEGFKDFQGFILFCSHFVNQFIRNFAFSLQSSFLIIMWRI